MTLDEKLEEMRKASQNSELKQDLGESSQDSKCQCGGMGWIPYKKDGLWFTKECECRAKEIAESRLRFANIPELFQELTLKTFRADIYREPESVAKINLACNIVKRYLENFEEMEAAGMGLYLVSHTKGSGKTRMAAGIANELMARGKQVKFAVSSAILKEIKDTWHEGSDYTESRLIDQLCLTEVLIVDDFGAEKISDWVNEKFYQILNERYVRRKVTIFTSNEKLCESKYDERIISRLKENCYEVDFPEESVRELLAEQKKAEMLKSLRS
ncbi:hypothetical protein F140042L4_26920 [Coprococcus phoceensis]|nr:MAG TPA: Replicative helicase [Caudoviricetes sp.]